MHQHYSLGHEHSESVKHVDGRDFMLNDLMKDQRPYCPCEWMDSEDPLFILYTSGSTGRPKGLLHTTAGYSLYAMTTTATTFDLQKGRENNFACMADAGWITGHSYIVYGPLVSFLVLLLLLSLFYKILFIFLSTLYIQSILQKTVKRFINIYV